MLQYDYASERVDQFVYGIGIDEQIEIYTGGNNYYYHENSLGSVVALTDATGNVVETYRYTDYGETVIRDSNGDVVESSLVGNPYGYTGRRIDPESGLYYYRARVYSPERGRFLQRDPLGYVDGMGLYTYVMGNPVNFVDPMGTEASKGNWADNLNRTNQISVDIINQYGPSGWSGWTSEQIINDELTSSNFGLSNAGWLPSWSPYQTNNSALRNKYSGYSTDDIGLMEATRRNSVRARVLLAENGLLSDREVLKLQLKAYGAMTEGAIETGLVLAPYSRVAKIGQPVRGMPTVRQDFTPKPKFTNQAFPKPWSEMSSVEKSAFQHALSRHGKELGIPNFSNKNAESLRKLNNSSFGFQIT